MKPERLPKLMTFMVDDIVAWSEKLSAWVEHQKQVFYLSSCSYPDAGNLGDYELIIGVGVKNRLVVDHGEHVEWKRFREMSGGGVWTFFVLAYDFHQLLSGSMKAQRVDELAWPLAYLVEPVHVITLRKSGELTVYSEDAVALVSEIKQQTTHKIPDYPVIYQGPMWDSMSRGEHREKVEYIKGEIAKGNMYEMNLCMETVIEDMVIAHPFLLHRDLLSISPTPFSSYVQLDGRHLLCASPERFVKKSGNRLYTQPIKGTAPRYADSRKDAASREFLARSVKDRAEHVMIVDLMRNDFGRLGEVGSVNVDELCAIYGYQQVYQLVSTISCKLQEEPDFLDILQAVFPMGSMTGAPKSIVMDYIAELEPCARGWYSGSVGYISPDGDFDSNVVIRSILYDEKRHKAKYSVGGAITFDSDPEAEYQECLLKASAIRQLLNFHGTVLNNCSM